MHHGIARRKLSRSSSHRRALFRNMASSFFLKDECETTVEKAKDLRRVTEKLISLARKDTLHARRQAYSYLLNKDAVHRLFAEVAPRFKTRPGGYTRVVRTRTRVGDAAEMAVLALVKEELKGGAKKKGGARKGKGKAAESESASEA